MTIRLDSWKREVKPLLLSGRITPLPNIQIKKVNPKLVDSQIMLLLSAVDGNPANNSDDNTKPFLSLLAFSDKHHTFRQLNLSLSVWLFQGVGCGGIRSNMVPICLRSNNGIIICPK